MIHIESKKLTITIEGPFIEETYTDIVTQLIDLLQLQNPEMVPQDNYFAVYSLLNALMPDYKQIKAINGIEADTE